MEVLLKEDVEHVGRSGQIVRVRAGFARNYLLPRKLAMVATPSNVKAIEQERQLLQRREAREKAHAQGVAEQLKEVSLQFVRKVSDQGILYGSVSSHDIAGALAERGVQVERRKIHLANPIKELGEVTVPVKLHRDVVIEIKVTVQKEGGEGAAEVAAPASPAQTAEAVAGGEPESQE